MHPKMQTFAIGIDFGTNSARAIVVSCADGSIAGTGVSDYHSGDHGVLTHPSDPHLARQNPADYIGSLGHAITTALTQASANKEFSRDRVIGIGVDTTGSTPLPRRFPASTRCCISPRERAGARATSTFTPIEMARRPSCERPVTQV